MSSPKNLLEKQESQQVGDTSLLTRIIVTIMLRKVDKVSWFITAREKPRMWQPYYIRMTNGELWPEVIHPATDRQELKRKVEAGIIWTYERYEWCGEVWKLEAKMLEGLKKEEKF